MNLPAFDVFVTIDFLGMTVGAPAGSTTLAGSVGASDVSLIFTFTVDPETPSSPNAFETLSLFNFGSVPESAFGTLPGSGVDVVDASLSLSRVGFDAPGLLPGETSDPFFVSYAGDPTGTEISFELLDGGFILGQVQIVPEPATALLLASGLLVFAGRRRRVARST